MKLKVKSNTILSLLITVLSLGSNTVTGNETNFEQTLKTVEVRIEKADLKIIQTIDHSKAALNVGLKLPRTTLLLVGNPKVGTKLMLENSQVALELPLKILITEDAGHKVIVTYKSPLVSMAPYLNESTKKIIEGMESKLKEITKLD